MPVGVLAVVKTVNAVKVPVDPDVGKFDVVFAGRPDTDRAMGVSTPCVRLGVMLMDTALPAWTGIVPAETVKLKSFGGGGATTVTVTVSGDGGEYPPALLLTTVKT
jgi:hypothetical protein